MSINIKIEHVKFGRIFVGLSGAGPINRPKIKKQLIDFFEYNHIPFERVNVVSDAFLAWYTAFRGGDGMVAISGTGTIVYGKVGNREFTSYNIKERKNLLRGGGFHIGIYTAKQCVEDIRNKKNSIILKIVVEAFRDGLLWKRFRDKVVLPVLLNDVMRSFEKEKFVYLKRQDVASLAQFTDLAAKKGSDAARKILHDTANQISANISVIAYLLGISGTGFRLAIVGSVMNSWQVRLKLKRRMKIEEPNAILVKPAFNALEFGALNIALSRLYEERNN